MRNQGREDRLRWVVGGVGVGVRDNLLVDIVAAAEKMSAAGPKGTICKEEWMEVLPVSGSCLTMHMVYSSAC
jgi:hypothetical protein